METTSNKSDVDEDDSFDVDNMEDDDEDDVDDSQRRVDSPFTRIRPSLLKSFRASKNYLEKLQQKKTRKLELMTREVPISPAFEAGTEDASPKPQQVDQSPAAVVTSQKQDMKIQTSEIESGAGESSSDEEVSEPPTPFTPSTAFTPPTPLGPPTPVTQSMGPATPLGPRTPKGPATPIGPATPMGPATPAGPATPIGPPTPVPPSTPIGPATPSAPLTSLGTPTPLAPSTPVVLSTNLKPPTPVQTHMVNGAHGNFKPPTPVMSSSIITPATLKPLNAETMHIPDDKSTIMSFDQSTSINREGEQPMEENMAVEKGSVSGAIFDAQHTLLSRGEEGVYADSQGYSSNIVYMEHDKQNETQTFEHSEIEANTEYLLSLDDAKIKQILPYNSNLVDDQNEFNNMTSYIRNKDPQMKQSNKVPADSNTEIQKVATSLSNEISNVISEPLPTVSSQLATPLSAIITSHNIVTSQTGTIVTTTGNRDDSSVTYLDVHPQSDPSRVLLPIAPLDDGSFAIIIKPFATGVAQMNTAGKSTINKLVMNRDRTLLSTAHVSNVSTSGLQISIATDTQMSIATPQAITTTPQTSIATPQLFQAKSQITIATDAQNYIANDTQNSISTNTQNSIATDTQNSIATDTQNSLYLNAQLPLATGTPANLIAVDTNTASCGQRVAMMTSNGPQVAVFVFWCRGIPYFFYIAGQPPLFYFT